MNIANLHRELLQFPFAFFENDKHNHPPTERESVAFEKRQTINRRQLKSVD